MPRNQCCPTIILKSREKIKEQTCESCFLEWETQQTMVINEYQLNTSIKEHREVLVKKLKEFLNIT